jgi:membrane protein YdbS with pleckstrin-like domain
MTTAPDDSPPATSPIADGRVHRLDPQVVTAERLGGWITTGVLGVPIAVGTALLTLVAALPGWVDVLLATVALAALGLLVWLAHGWPAVSYRHRSWRLDDDGIEIRRGVVWRRVISIPRSRVQHTDVAQGPIERSLGLSHLVIHTAGTTGASVTLEGLDRTTAVRIRDHLVDVEGSDAAIGGRPGAGDAG